MLANDDVYGAGDHGTDTEVREMGGIEDGSISYFRKYSSLSREAYLPSTSIHIRLNPSEAL
jgi:hypothetical protein